MLLEQHVWRQSDQNIPVALTHPPRIDRVLVLSLHPLSQQHDSGAACLTSVPAVLTQLLLLLREVKIFPPKLPRLPMPAVELLEPPVF